MELKKKIALGLAFILLFSIFTSCKKQEVKTVEPTEERIVEEKPAETPEVVEVSLTDVSYLEELEKEAIKVPFQLSKIDPKVADYSIEPDLSNVKNAEFFGEFSDAQRKFLVENGFLITKTPVLEYEGNRDFMYDQIHQIYDDNEYKSIPSFVTTDSMTHIFHIFYDGFLRDIEKNELYPKSIEMTKKLLESNIEIYNQLENQRLKELQLKNVAFFAVGANILGAEVENVPTEAEELIQRELKNIENKSPGESSVADKIVDFSQMTVRGHYTRSEELEKYFLSTMYYGQIGLFPFDSGKVDEDAILKSLLITHSTYKDPEIFKLWTTLVDPIDFLVESADDLSLREYGKVLYSVYGENPELNKLDEKIKLEKVVELIRELPKPLIAPFQGQSFRFIPQRSVFDNVLMQKVVDIERPSKRPIYSGLDVMAMLGNEKAKEIQYSNEYNSHWNFYKERTEENISLVKSMSDESWQRNLYRGWLWMLESYKNTYEEGYPMFMRNENWEKKDIVSGLGSYAELKHDTVLYAKPVAAEMGGGGPKEIPKSYVEPNLELYEKLSWLLEYTKVNLKDREMLSQQYEEKLDRFKEMVDNLTRLTKKELNNEAFTEEEYKMLYNIGGEMESIALKFVESEDEEIALRTWYEIENSTDRRMPIIVDLMKVVENTVGLEEGKILSIGTGKPAEIYVIYPQDGELHMGRGGIFTYHEFLADERLTDEQWQKTLLENDMEIPDWYKDIVFEEKAEFEGDIDNYDW